MTTIQFANDVGEPDALNVLLYGPPGSGKTTAAATTPGRIVWLNFQGRTALSFARKTAGERGQTLDEVRVLRGEDPRQPMRQLVEYVRVNDDVGTVVVDTIGDLRESLAAALSKGNTPTLPEWGEIGKTLMDFVKLLRDLKCHVVVIAHEEVADAGDQDRIVRPMIGGKSTEQVCAEMDVIAYCGVVRKENEPVRYVGQLVEQRGRRAKDRSGALGSSRDLELSEWIDTFRDGVKPDESDIPFSEDFVEPVDGELVA